MQECSQRVMGKRKKYNKQNSVHGAIERCKVQTHQQVCPLGFASNPSLSLDLHQGGTPLGVGLSTRPQEGTNTACGCRDSSSGTVSITVCAKGLADSAPESTEKSARRVSIRQKGL